MNGNHKVSQHLVPALTLALAAAMVVGGVASGASAATRHKKKPVPAATVRVEVPPKANLTETGSTLLYPLWNIWAPAYQSVFPQVNVTTGGTGSGTGIADAASGTVNIGSSDAYLSPTQLSATPDLLNIPLGISYQMIVYNVTGVHAHLKLTGPVLAQIYQGTIKNWDDPAISALNPGVTLPNLPIVALHRSDGSGDTFIFTQYLSRTDASWRNTVAFGTTVSFPTIPNSLGEVGNGGMVSGCNATPGCVAYVGISFLSDVLNDALSYAALENGVGQFVVPTPKSAELESAAYQKLTPASGTISMINGRVNGGYPIVNYEYAIVNDRQASASTARAVRSLLEWCINARDGNSGQYLSQVRFDALPPSVRAQSAKQIHRIQ